jgi:phosphate transport system substrate-binding protein
VRVAQRRVARLLVILLTLGLVAATCGSSSKSGSSGTTDTSATSGTDFSALSGTIKGGGSSFADALYQQVIDKFAEAAPNVTVTYDPVGSGQGKKDFTAKLKDFAGTDSLVKPEEAAAGSYLYFPTAAAPITVSYNLDGVAKLQLSPDTLAKLFQGTIKTWDDAAVKTDNPGVTLPSTPVVIVHRSDGSGTTSAFTKYLAKAAPTVWTLGAGDTVSWPASSQAGAKNTGVAQIVKSTKGAIGYVDFADAKQVGLSFAAIKNKAGTFTAPTLTGASESLAGATVMDDLTMDALDAAGAKAYPITAVTYILLRPTYPAAIGKAVKGFVEFVLTTGQSEAAGVNYAKLPADLADKAIAQLDKVTVS